MAAEYSISTAVHGDGFQILRAHDRADAGAPRRTVQIVYNAGIAHSALSGDSDGSDLQQRILMARLDPLLGLPHAGAPELIGR